MSVKKYDDILFDADDTLFDYKKAETVALQKTLAYFGRAYDHDIQTEYRLINQSLWQKFEMKKITVDELQVERFKLLFRKTGVTESADDFNLHYLNELADGAQLISGAQKLCDDLSQFCRLTIVTNGISRTQRRRFGKSTIKKDFEALFISGDIGFQKPQTELFDYVFASLQIADKSRVLMVGDNLSTDILGGINAGIDTCWFNCNKAVNKMKIKADFEIQSLDELRRIVFPDQIR